MTTETRTEMDRFIEERQITMDAVRVDRNPNVKESDWDAGASHWRCTFRINASSFETYFSMGSAHTQPPTAADVLDCLASDASGIGLDDVSAQLDFEEWANEYGYDTDSISALHTYNLVKSQTVALHDFLGGSGYRELIEDIERL